MWETCFQGIAQLAEQYENLPPDNNIPKIIFQTYKSEEKLPTHWKESPNSWRKSHPEYRYIFYTDDDCHNLIRTKFPWFFSIYMQFPYPIQRFDSFRPFALFDHGGFYIDMDIQNKPGKSLDDLLRIITHFAKVPSAYCLQDPLGLLMDEHHPWTGNPGQEFSTTTAFSPPPKGLLEKARFELQSYMKNTGKTYNGENRDRERNRDRDREREK